MSLKILIAEDEEDIAYQYRMALDALGHEVVLTKNGEELLRQTHRLRHRNTLRDIHTDRHTQRQAD